MGWIACRLGSGVLLRRVVCLAGWLLAAQFATPWGVRAEPPSTVYIFPAGGQRGTQVTARVGGHYLHDRARWEMLEPGVTAPAEIVATETVWFEGPLVRLPASQRAEDYPRDYLAPITIAADAPQDTLSRRRR